MIRTDNAYAKVNLTLDVLGLRPDGFHDIESLMQLTGLYDRITLEEGGHGLSLASDNAFLPLDEKNICYRAAMNFYRYFSIPETKQNARITIEKRIPISAGLGGGSADGAAVLRLLARLHKIKDRQGLLEVAAQTGSDVPFCLVGGTAVCRGRGEKMTPAASCPVPVYLVIAKNTTGLSTPAIYQAFDQLAVVEDHPPLAACLQALEQGNVGELARSVFNAMEQVSVPKRPAIAQLKEKMLAMGAVGAKMSGSGPSVFGLFAREQEARSCCMALRREKIVAYHTQFLNKTLW